MTRIAIVDHDADLSELLSELFELEGYDSVICPPAEATPRALSAADVDLILFDGWFDEPYRNWALLETLRRDPRTVNTPVVLCSGDATELQDNAAWLEAADVSAIAKPFDLEALFDVIESRLRTGTSAGTRG